MKFNLFKKRCERCGNVVQKGQSFCPDCITHYLDCLERRNAKVKSHIREQDPCIYCCDMARCREINEKVGKEAYATHYVVVVDTRRLAFIRKNEVGNE